jgi:leader peptidase (prepilin peptidase)/N-methyltransferase
MNYEQILTIMIILIIGSFIGSFVSLISYRWPKNLSIITPRSYCEHCNTTLSWNDNIPLIGFIIKLGRCSYCKEKISAQSFAVEWITGLSFVLVYIYFGLNISSVLLMTISAIMILDAEIDFNETILPDLLNLLIAIFGVVINVYGYYFHRLFFATPIQMLFGGIIGFLILYIINITYKLIRKKDGIGMGDMKLLCATGILFGYQSLYQILMISVFSAFVYIIITMLINFKNKINLSNHIPFGPYIILGSFVYMYYGNFLIKAL